MDRFERGHTPDSELEKVRENCRKLGLDEEQTEEQVEFIRNSVVFVNDTYQVSVHEPEYKSPNFPEMIWLSIKRRDKEPIKDWRDMQEIKNQLVGEEHEAVELYPAESRLVDSANQYHLWVLKEEGLQFPFGFPSRFVRNEDPVGGKQRSRE